jgi:hypothetical protein
MTESYIVAPPNVPGISISAYWTTNSLIFQVAIAIADKFDSLKVGDKITLLTGQMPANTVLTVTGPATSPKTVIQNSYYVYTIPVNSSPSTVRPSVDSFSITRTTGGTVSSLVNGAKTVSLASTGVLTVTGSIVPNANIAYDLGSATNRFKDIYLSSSTINLGDTAVSVGSSGQLTIAETFSNIVSGGDIALAQWNTTKQFRVTAKLAFADKFSSLKIGEQIILLTGASGAFPANTVLTITNTVTKTLVQGNQYYDFVIPVNIAPPSLTAIASFSLKTTNGNNATTRPLEFFGGEGFGPRDAGTMSWGDNGTSWGNAVFSVERPGAELRIAIYNLKIGDTIRIKNPPFNYVDDTLTITGTATEVTTGIIRLQVDRAPPNSNPNFAYALYLPVIDSSATIVNGTKNLTVLPNGYVVFPTVTAPANSYGVSGDVAGMVAFDSTYIYYCTANYVNNTTNIWKRTAHGTGTW